MKNFHDDTFDLSQAINGLKNGFGKNAKELSNFQIAIWLLELDERRPYHHYNYSDIDLLYQTIAALEPDNIDNTLIMATPDKISNWLQELYELRATGPIEYYGEQGTADNIKEYKKLCKELAKERKKHKGEESNVECLIIDKITELISKMKLVEVRKLKLFE